MTDENLFKDSDCDIDAVPVVDFDFIPSDLVCETIPTPAPIFSCVAPVITPEPPTDVGVECPVFSTTSKIEVGYKNNTGGDSACTVAANPSATLQITKTNVDPCDYEINLDINVPIPRPPCLTVLQGGSFNAQVGFAECIPPGASIQINRVDVPGDCETPDECQYTIDLDIGVPIPRIPCPELRLNTFTTTSGYESCVNSAENRFDIIAVHREPNGCDDPGQCEFEIDLQIAVPIPEPPCPTLSVVNFSTQSAFAGTVVDTDGKIIAENCSQPNRFVITTEQTPATCDTPPQCNFGLDLEVFVPIPRIPCPDVRIGNFSVQSGYAYCLVEPENKFTLTTKHIPPTSCQDPGRCAFELDLQIAVPIPDPPCPVILPGSLNVTSGFGGNIAYDDGTGKLIVVDTCGGENSITITTEHTPSTCDTPAKCEFQVGLDIFVPVPRIPCPVISTGAVSIISGYDQCVPPIENKLEVITRHTAPQSCDDPGTCAFDLNLQIGVPIPTPTCPTINVGSATLSSGLFTDNKNCGNNSLNFTVEQSTTPATCDTAPECNFVLNFDGNIAIPRTPCPVITAQNFVVTTGFIGSGTGTQSTLQASNFNLTAPNAITISAAIADINNVQPGTYITNSADIAEKLTAAAEQSYAAARVTPTAGTVTEKIADAVQSETDTDIIAVTNTSNIRVGMPVTWEKATTAAATTLIVTEVINVSGAQPSIRVSETIVAEKLPEPGAVIEFLPPAAAPVFVVGEPRPGTAAVNEIAVTRSANIFALRAGMAISWPNAPAELQIAEIVNIFDESEPLILRLNQSLAESELPPAATIITTVLPPNTTDVINVASLNGLTVGMGVSWPTIKVSGSSLTTYTEYARDNDNAVIITELIPAAATNSWPQIRLSVPVVPPTENTELTFTDFSSVASIQRETTSYIRSSNTFILNDVTGIEPWMAVIGPTQLGFSALADLARPQGADVVVMNVYSANNLGTGPGTITVRSLYSFFDVPAGTKLGFVRAPARVETIVPITDNLVVFSANNAGAVISDTLAVATTDGIIAGMRVSWPGSTDDDLTIVEVIPAGSPTASTTVTATGNSTNPLAVTFLYSPYSPQRLPLPQVGMRVTGPQIPLNRYIRVTFEPQYTLARGATGQYMFLLASGSVQTEKDDVLTFAFVEPAKIKLSKPVVLPLSDVGISFDLPTAESKIRPKLKQTTAASGDVSVNLNNNVTSTSGDLLVLASNAVQTQSCGQGTNAFSITPRHIVGTSCDEPDQCAFDVNLEINVPIPRTPCPTIAVTKFAVAAGYPQCIADKQNLLQFTTKHVAPTSCNDPGSCEFGLELELAIPIPEPNCPEIYVKSTQVRSGLISEQKTPDNKACQTASSLIITKTETKDCNGAPRCEFALEFDLGIFVPRVPCPNIVVDSFKVATAFEGCTEVQSGNVFSIVPRHIPGASCDDPGFCEFGVTLAVAVPIPRPVCPVIYVKEFVVNTKIQSSTQPCITEPNEFTITPKIVPAECPTKQPTCEFETTLRLNVPIPEVPCPQINVNKFSVKSGFNTGDCETGENRFSIIAREIPGSCTTPKSCAFDLDLEIYVPIPKPRCPDIQIGSFNVSSGFTGEGCEAGSNSFTIEKVVVAEGDCDTPEECAFFLNLDIAVPIPPPKCPSIGSQSTVTITVTDATEASGKGSLRVQSGAGCGGNANTGSCEEAPTCFYNIVLELELEIPKVCDPKLVVNSSTVDAGYDRSTFFIATATYTARPECLLTLDMDLSINVPRPPCPDITAQVKLLTLPSTAAPFANINVASVQVPGEYCTYQILLNLGIPQIPPCPQFLPAVVNANWSNGNVPTAEFAIEQAFFAVNCVYIPTLKLQIPKPKCPYFDEGVVDVYWLGADDEPYLDFSIVYANEVNGQCQYEYNLILGIPKFNCPIFREGYVGVETLPWYSPPTVEFEILDNADRMDCAFQYALRLELPGPQPCPVFNDNGVQATLVRGLDAPQIEFYIRPGARDEFDPCQFDYYLKLDIPEQCPVFREGFVGVETLPWYSPPTVEFEILDDAGRQDCAFQYALRLELPGPQPCPVFNENGVLVALVEGLAAPEIEFYIRPGVRGEFDPCQFDYYLKLDIPDQCPKFQEGYVGVELLPPNDPPRVEFEMLDNADRVDCAFQYRLELFLPRPRPCPVFVKDDVFVEVRDDPNFIPAVNFYIIPGAERPDGTCEFRYYLKLELAKPCVPTFSASGDGASGQIVLIGPNEDPYIDFRITPGAQPCHYEWYIKAGIPGPTKLVKGTTNASWTDCGGDPEIDVTVGEPNADGEQTLDIELRIPRPPDYIGETWTVEDNGGNTLGSATSSIDSEGCRRGVGGSIILNTAECPQDVAAFTALPTAAVQAPVIPLRGLPEPDILATVVKNLQLDDVTGKPVNPEFYGHMKAFFKQIQEDAHE